MIEIALLLAKNVTPAYYADAECYGRNHLLESQFLSLDRLERALESMPESADPAPNGGRFSTSKDIAKRQVGAFASRPTLNDAFHLDSTDLMQCCNAAGTRALYDLWSCSVESLPGVGSGLPGQILHLRFSVETPSLKVVSHEPAEGRLEITARERCRVSVRIPAGTGDVLAVRRGAPGGVQVDVLQQSGGYAAYEAATGELVELVYPLAERSAAYRVGSKGREIHAVASWRGETVMSIEPAGLHCPLYERSASNQAAEPRLPAEPLIASI
jgi:hypothetical protein